MTARNLSTTYTVTFPGDTEATTITPTVRTKTRPDGVTLTIVKGLAPLLADHIDAITDEGDRLHALTALSGATIYISDTPEDDRPENGESSGSFWRDRGTLSTTYYGAPGLPVSTVLDLAEQLRAQLLAADEADAQPTPEEKNTSVTITLHTDAKHVTDRDGVQWTPARPLTIDLDALTPRARALAEAVAQLPGARADAGEILCHHRTKTRGDMTPDAESWLSPERLAQPARQAWAKWDIYRADSEVSPVEYLESQARKIPPDWRIVCGHAVGRPDPAPVPSSQEAGNDNRLTPRAVVEYLAAHHKRHIGPSTWRSYVARGQAPAPVGRVGRESLWSPADVDAWATGEWRAAQD